MKHSRCLMNNPSPPPMNVHISSYPMHLNDGVHRLALGLCLECCALCIVDLGQVSTPSSEGADIAPLPRVPLAWRKTLL